MRLLTTLAALIMVAAVAGCSSVPIMNVSDAPTTAPTGKALSREQVRSAIVRAGAVLGWQMVDENPNVLVGTLQLRTHTAVVENAQLSAS